MMVVLAGSAASSVSSKVAAHDGGKTGGILRDGKAVDSVEDGGGRGHLLAITMDR